ncbi:MAG: flagellar assembly protein T N-terminal domain-containing protein [Alphaproteobacteria bacterium]
MVNIVSKIPSTLILLCSVISGMMLLVTCIANASPSNSFQFTTATGRAAITSNVPAELARMRALQDALYLAALQGGANINGFSAVSTDTSVQDHFVVRPSSKIIDYTILSEEKSDSQIEVSIRAAVGNLPETKCNRTRPLNMTIYRPDTYIDMNVPAWIEIYHSKLFNELTYMLDSDPLIKISNAMNVPLSPKKLKTIDEKFDYASVLSPQIRVRPGDFAIIPTLYVSAEDRTTRFLTSRQIEIKLGLKVFSGANYDLIGEFKRSTLFENDTIALFQNLADLDKPTREDLIEVMTGLIEPLTSEMITTLGCQSLNDTLYLDAQRLTAQLGSNQGVTPNMLAITSGKHSPWTVLRVVSVSSNSSILEPLDKARELSELDGKVVEFMELN